MSCDETCKAYDESSQRMIETHSLLMRLVSPKISPFFKALSPVIRLNYVEEFIDMER